MFTTLGRERGNEENHERGLPWTTKEKLSEDGTKHTHARTHAASMSATDDCEGEDARRTDGWTDAAEDDRAPPSGLKSASTPRGVSAPMDSAVVDCATCRRRRGKGRIMGE